MLTEDEQKDIKDNLKDLRNRMSVGFLFLNGVFVITLYVLQSNTATLYVPWPCDDKHGNNITLDPLGFTFLVMFGLLMVVQIVGMLMHRTTTFLHIMSTTFLSASQKEHEEENTQFMIKLAKNLGNLESQVPFDNATFNGSTASFGNKKQHHMLTMRRPIDALTVNAAFQKRWDNLKSDLESDRVDISTLVRKTLGRQATGRFNLNQTKAILQTLRQKHLGDRVADDDDNRTVTSITETSTEYGSVISNRKPGVRFVLEENRSHGHSRNSHDKTLMTYDNPAFTFPEPKEDYD